MKYLDVLVGLAQAGVGAGVIAQVVKGQALSQQAQIILVIGFVLVTMTTVFLAHLRSYEDEDD